MVISICSSVKRSYNINFVESSEALLMLKNGKWKAEVERYRNSKTRENKEDLPSIMWSGTFENRTDASLIDHSGLLCLDFDDVVDIQNFKELLKENKYTHAIWTSPSETGIKCLVKSKANKENHKELYESICYEYNLIETDKSCINLARHCFVSYDPDLWVNEKSSIYDPVLMPKNNTYQSVLIPNTDRSKAFNILEKWHSKKFPMVKGNRNNNAVKFAKACNDYGVDQSICEAYLGRYVDSDFSEKELLGVIKSGYKEHLSFGTKFFEDEVKISKIRVDIFSGKKESDILEENNISKDVFIKIKTDISEFWDINANGKVKIIPHKFKYFLQDNGFFIYKRGDENDRVFVRIQNRVACIVSTKEIKDFIVNYLEDLNLLHIWDHTADNLKLFESKYLDFLSYVEINSYENTTENTRFYFNDCAVDVTKDEIIRVEYHDVKEIIWKSIVLPVNYCENNKKLKSDYEQFIIDITDGDIDKFKAFCSVVGYLVCGYNERSTQKAIILNDRNKGKFANGGSGKGIFVQGIKLLKRACVEISMQTFKTDRSHIWNQVNYDTEIVFCDELKKDFKLNIIYSEITEGISIEKKYKDSVKIPFSKTPKFILATNYGIDTIDGSTLRRVHELELSNKFNHSFTPKQKYGKDLFDYNTPEEWGSYLEFMFGCLRFYKQNGLVKDTFVELNEKKMINVTNEEFWDFFQEYDFDYVKGITLSEVSAFGEELNKETDLGLKFRNKENKIPIDLLKKWLETTWVYYGISFLYTRKSFNGIKERVYVFTDPVEATKIKNNKYNMNMEIEEVTTEKLLF